MTVIPAPVTADRCETGTPGAALDEPGFSEQKGPA